MSNHNKNITFVDVNMVNVMNISAKLDKTDMFGRGLLKEHLCNFFVKISAVG